MFEVISLPSQKWSEFKLLRLEALKEEPLAFGVSYEEEKERPDSYWKARLEDSTILFAQKEGELIGMGIIILARSLKFRHIARISGIYVKKGFRGKGIANAIIDSLLKEAFEKRNIEKVKLTVNKTQISAIKLYKSLGFRIVGTMKNEFKIEGKFYDAYLMEKARVEF